jgi:hypothetical protein
MLDTDSDRRERKRCRQQIPQPAHARVIDHAAGFGEQYLLKQGTRSHALPQLFVLLEVVDDQGTDRRRREERRQRMESSVNGVKL